jgi:hypothetical protein
MPNSGSSARQLTHGWLDVVEEEWMHLGFDCFVFESAQSNSAARVSNEDLLCALEPQCARPHPIFGKVCISSWICFHAA